jgi:hypothetical protein
VVVEAVRRGYTGLVDLEHDWLDLTMAGEQAGLTRVRVFYSQVTQGLATTLNHEGPDSQPLDRMAVRRC